MGRACALVEQMGKDTASLKDACQYLDVSSDRRAQIIIATVYEALAKAELKAPARVHGTFIAAGGTLDAYAAVGRVLGGAKASVLMVDPYADVKIVMEYAVLAPENVPIQVLADSDKKKHKATLKPAAERYEQQFRGSRAPLEVRLAPANTLHDRLIIVDHNSVWLLGQSFNALAERSPTSLIRANDETAQMKIAAYGAPCARKATVAACYNRRVTSRALMKRE
jgi:hypothetical protein